MSKQLTQELVESVNRLAATDPTSGMVGNRVQEVFMLTKKICEAADPTADKPVAPALAEFMVDNPPADSVVDQIDQMRSAAARPAANYVRIISILDGLRHVAMLAQRPQNAAVRPRIAKIVNKVAGVFKNVDTVQDLDKPLEQIEKAVHALYGDQSKNGTFYFTRRGKGLHGEAE